MFAASRVLRASVASVAQGAKDAVKKEAPSVLQKGARRDPELYVQYDRDGSKRNTADTVVRSC